MDTADPPAKKLYSVIWMDHYPKKIKDFLWELNLGVVNIVDRLQRRMLYMSLSILVCYVSEPL